MAVLRHVLGVWTVILLALAAVNVIVITWTTVLDNRRATAVLPGELRTGRKNPRRRAARTPSGR